MDYYDAISTGYDELYSEEQMKKLFVLKKALDDSGIDVKKGMKVLDVGCGSGIAQKFFDFECGAVTFGIDPSKKLLEINPLPSKKMKAEDMKFDDDEFDLVVSLTAIQNFDDIKMGLIQIRRVGRYFALSFLKDCGKSEEITENIQELFDVIKRIEEEKDMIYIARKDVAGGQDDKEPDEGEKV